MFTAPLKILFSELQSLVDNLKLKTLIDLVYFKKNVDDTRKKVDFINSLQK